MQALHQMSRSSNTQPQAELFWKVVFGCLLICLSMTGQDLLEAAPEQEMQGGSKLNVIPIQIGATTIKAHHANTIASRIEGLLGWDTITYEQGMLLDFDREGEYAIHMQGMKFPIDAVWIDRAKTIRLIYQNIQPNSGVTYPSLFKSIYCLGLKAGFCKKFNVEVGQKVVMSSE